MARRSIAPVLCCALMVAVAAPAEASFSGANGLLAYEHTYWTPSNSIGTTQGPGFTSIVTGAVNEPRNIAWSADGKRLAFDGPATSGGTGRALYVVNADGTGLKQVGRGDRRRSNPAWSPGGTKLVFVQDNGAGAGAGDIYTIATSGAGLKRLTTAPSWDGAPDWSPDGTRIAYVCRSGGRSQLCQITPAGTGRTVTTASLALPGGVIGSSWSPDGASLAFSVSAGTGGSARIYRVSQTGGALKLLRAPDAGGASGPVRAPAWSPDGTRIAIELGSAGNGALVTVRSSDGGDERLVVGNDSALPLDPGGWQAVR